MSVHAFVVSCLIICNQCCQVSPIQKCAITPRPTPHRSDHSTAIQSLVTNVSSHCPISVMCPVHLVGSLRGGPWGLQCCSWVQALVGCRRGRRIYYGRGVMASTATSHFHRRCCPWSPSGLSSKMAQQLQCPVTLRTPPPRWRQADSRTAWATPLLATQTNPNRRGGAQPQSAQLPQQSPKTGPIGLAIAGQAQPESAERQQQPPPQSMRLRPQRPSPNRSRCSPMD